MSVEFSHSEEYVVYSNREGMSGALGKIYNISGKWRFETYARANHCALTFEDLEEIAGKLRKLNGVSGGYHVDV